MSEWTDVPAPTTQRVYWHARHDEWPRSALVPATSAAVQIGAPCPVCGVLGLRRIESIDLAARVFECSVGSSVAMHPLPRLIHQVVDGGERIEVRDTQSGNVLPPIPDDHAVVRHTVTASGDVVLSAPELDDEARGR